MTLIRVYQSGSRYVRPKVYVRCDGCGSCYFASYRVSEITPERRCGKCASAGNGRRKA